MTDLILLALTGFFLGATLALAIHGWRALRDLDKALDEALEDLGDILDGSFTEAESRLAYQPELPFEEHCTRDDLGRLIRRTAFTHEPGDNPSAYQASRRTAEAILDNYVVTKFPR